MELDLPIGYHSFHKDKHFNFQMNRWVSLGFARAEDFESVASSIKSFEDWKREMIGLAEKAEFENRMINAAFYYRAAEFFTFSDDDEKLELYERFQTLFYDNIEDPTLKVSEVPFEFGYLHTLRFSPPNAHRTLVFHGGLDSFIEEFYTVAKLFANRGCEVILFEGPGQGKTFRRHGIKLTHEWEKPTSAILDYFNISDVTLIGISLGGFLCLRAAAFEPRISQVVAFDVYVYQHLNPESRLTRFLKNHPNFYNRIVGLAMSRSVTVRFLIRQWLDITGAETPYDWGFSLGDYSTISIAEKVEQDVLLLAGETDHLISPRELEKTKQGLINARSVTTRIFTQEEHASNHCQVGNIPLATDVILNWIQQPIRKDSL
ncbi:MAG: alpha/beta fold hydrolase [Candidatus Thorarchaeota archaeon]|jgi:pimeloyl-ACP methyl ester carboxylesterase